MMAGRSGSGVLVPSSRAAAGSPQHKPMAFPSFHAGPGPLADCQFHGAGAELFVVEGESAAAAVCGGRDPARQAVLPMQGKPLNALKATEKKVAANPLFAALAAALGSGWGEALDLQKLRYSKVLLLMDPDADGIHCGLLLLGFFHRWMRPLLDGGHLWLIRPPWGEVVMPGEPPRWPISEREFQLAAVANGQRPAQIRRFRGLAGIDADVLKATCLEPATRRAEPVTTPEVAGMIELFGASFRPTGPGGV